MTTKELVNMWIIGPSRAVWAKRGWLPFPAAVAANQVCEIPHPFWLCLAGVLISFDLHRHRERMEDKKQQEADKVRAYEAAEAEKVRAHEAAEASKAREFQRKLFDKFHAEDPQSSWTADFGPTGELRRIRRIAPGKSPRVKPPRSNKRNPAVVCPPKRRGTKREAGFTSNVASVQAYRPPE